ncbi:hypothetical protein GOBAR_AA08281 [Gossypium barbadense]|uniref:Protein kinase domain-containing protein n=1 Tax=Gossypium barbadense TaxID=3634 RepID=A0A2P5Y9T9_GOSBA|nr:hypothetical protein GOBAR_AA08281 [Gossypium barbadense]
MSNVSVIFVASEQPAYVPTDNITLNCGATTDLLANDGRSWAADKTSKFGPFKSSHNKSQAYEANTQDGSETVPYMTVRVSRSEFKYTFPVTPGQKFVLLYFHAESYKEYDRSKAFFPVKAGSFTLLKNFSASLVANSKGRNWFPREFYLNVEDNEVLDLVFTPSRSASNDTYAFINGIEIVSMPTNLYYTPPDSGYVPFIGHSYPFPVENDTALEMAYRLNVEGKSISPNDDPGLFRLWSDDSLYMTKNSYVTVNTSMPINYTMIQRYTAPKMVYRIARTMGPSLAYNEKHNLSWRLPVGSGFKYMVRLHFCEPQDLINSPGDWTFKVFINNQTAEENADVIMWTGHARVSIFKDYVVFVSKEYITIDLHPIHHQYYDVILNGIEVFKLSNSDGNLGEPNPELRVAPPPPSDSFNSAGAKTKKRSLLIACVGCAAGLITIISLLVCMVVQQQRKGTSWLCWWVNQNEGKSTRTSLLPDELCRHFSLDEIKAATNNFHDDLVVGKCGFGKVFKGFIDEGEKIVAIKRLNLESSQGIGEFLIEIKMLFQLRHQAFVLQQHVYKLHALHLEILQQLHVPNMSLSTPPCQSPIPFVGQNYPFPVENDTALEMAYRLNVGGQSISPNDDTGLFRLWSDDFFYMTKNSYVTVNASVPITYTMIRRYTAPEMVYRTARTMGPSLAYNKKHNLSWRLPVGSGFRYMVRLHFCEPQDLINSPGDRKFQVFINSQTAEQNADVIMWTGQGRIPIFKDYVVLVSKEYITIDLHPILAKFYDVILNGIEVFKLSNSDGNLGEPNPELRVAPPPPSDSSNSAGAKSKKRSLLIAGVGCAAGLIAIISLLVYMAVRRQRKGTSLLCWWINQNEGKSTRTSLLPDELCRHFSLDEIKAATNNFHDDLVVGKGGFGKVYKGFMDEGEKIVAIKRLNPESSQGIREFLTEIEMLSQLRHVHLVSLIGYCNEKREMILVYDFMSNGTLSDHLYGTSFAYDPLTWKQRLEICKGAATGLNYLHTEVRHTVIHRDVKTNNILLDDKFTAKVSDFGLSKEDPKDEMLITGIKGTRGYMDPEYARGHKLTEKSDVYAFGVVLFEVLCARKAVNTKLPEAQMSLAHWAKQCIADGTLYKVIDPYLIGKIAPECFKVFVEIAESCIADVGTDRPSMNDVMERLGFAIELQKAADAEMSKMEPASECSYPDIVFPVARDMDFDDESEVYSELDSNVCRGVGLLDSDTTGLTYPSIDSSTSMYTFTSTTNNTKSIGN